MALKISYPEPGDNVPQWATEDTQLQIKAILEKEARPTSGKNKADKDKDEQTKKSTKALKNLEGGLEELTGLVGTTAGVITQTKGEFKDLVPIVDAFGNLLKKGFGAALSAIPFFGDALKTGSDLVIEFSKDAFSFLASTADTLVDTFQDTATRGAFFDNSLQELVSSATSARISLEELGDVLDQNTLAIATFGDANLGAKQILQNLEVIQKRFGEELLRLGLNFSDINESASGFFELLAATGQADLLRAGQTEQLANQTNRYIRDLTVLASITGKQRKEVEREFRAQVLRGNVQAQLTLLQEKNNEGAVQAFGNIATLLEGFSPVLSDAFASIATANIATGEQEAVLAQLGNSRQLIQEFGSAFQDGTLSAERATELQNQIAEEVSSSLLSADFTSLAALGTGPIGGLPRILADVAQTAIPLAQAFQKGEINFDNLREKVNIQATSTDEGTTALVDAQKAIADIPLDIQKALITDEGSVVKTLGTVAKNIESFGNVLQRIIAGEDVETILADSGGSRPNPGGDSIQDMFDKFKTAAMRSAGGDRSKSTILNVELGRLKEVLPTLDMQGLKVQLNRIIDLVGLDIQPYNRGTMGVQNFGNGTLAMLHGNEAVIPAPRGEIPVDLGNTLQPLQDTLTNLVEGMRNTNTTVATNDVNMLQSNDVVQKLETMIGVLKSIADGTAQGNTMFGKEIRRLGNQMSADLYR